MSRFCHTFLGLCLLIVPSAASAQVLKTAIFAGGCFWCMESEFSGQKGVTDVMSGYAGGEGDAPTYEEVSSGQTGFRESILVTYDPGVVSYQTLLDIFWSNVDPFDDKGQFCDKGAQYLAAIFVGDEAEQALAAESVKKVEEKFQQKVATQILPKTSFYPAEEYHQDFYLKNTDHYKRYRKGCGRDETLKGIWGAGAQTGEQSPK